MVLVRALGDEGTACHTYKVAFLPCATCTVNAADIPVSEKFEISKKILYFHINRTDNYTPILAQHKQHTCTIIHDRIRNVGERS